MSEDNNTIDLDEHEKKESKAEEDDEILELAKQRYRESVVFWGDCRELQNQDLKFLAASPDNKWQWPDSMLALRERDPHGSRPCLTINKAPQHVNQIVNDYRMNRPSIKVRPQDSNADVKVAEIFDGIIRNVEKTSNAHMAYDMGCKSQVSVGAGYWRVLTQYVNPMSFDQEMSIAPIRNQFKVIIDPKAQLPTAADARFIFIVEAVPRKEYEDEHGEDEDVDWDTDDLTLWRDHGEDTVTVAEYFVLKDVEVDVHALNDGRVVDDEMLEKIENPVVVATRKSRMKRLCWYKLSGNKILDRRETKGQYHTVIRALGNEYEVDGKVHISGVIRNFKDAQRSYNYWSSVLVEKLALQSKAPIIGYAGQFEGHEKKWRTSNTVNYPYLEVNPVTDNSGGTLPLPQRMPSSPDLEGIVRAMMIAGDDMKTVTGQYDASLGQKSNETSGRAIMARQKEGDVGSYHYVDNMNSAVLQTGIVLADLVPHVMDTRRVLRILGDDGKPTHAVIDPGMKAPVTEMLADDGQMVGRIYNLGIGRYDVDITVGPGFETKRQEQVAAMAEMTKANPQLWQVIGDLMVRAQDWPGADKMAERLKLTLLPPIQQMENENNPLPPEIAAQIQAAQQQVQQQQAMMAEQAQQFAQAQESAVTETHKAQMARKDVEIMSERLEAEKIQLQYMRQLLDARTAEQMMRLEKEKESLTSEIEDLLDASDQEQRTREEGAKHERAEAEGAKSEEHKQFTQALERQVKEQAKFVQELQQQVQQAMNKAKTVTVKAPSGGSYTGRTIPKGDGTSEIVVTTPTGEQYTGAVN